MPSFIMSLSASLLFALKIALATLLAWPMLTWLAGDLAHTNQPWVIAFWHHPPYSKGSHDSDTDSGGMEIGRSESVCSSVVRISSGSDSRRGGASEPG